MKMQRVISQRNKSGKLVREISSISYISDMLWENDILTTRTEEFIA